jgi:hypothetical protein
MMTIEESKLEKIAGGLALAHGIIFDIIKTHNIYPSVGNVAYVEEALRDALELLPADARARIMAATRG